MGLLTETTKVTRVAEGGEATTVQTKPAGQRLVLLAVIAIAFGAFATYLYSDGKDAGAGALLAVSTSILFGGFGITVGEASGAGDAAKVLK